MKHDAEKAEITFPFCVSFALLSREPLASQMVFTALWDH